MIFQHIIYVYNININLSKQHNQIFWLDRHNLLQNNSVHQNTKEYFIN